MITDTIDPVAPPEPKRCNLILHCGAQAVSRQIVAQAPVPEATPTWQPVAHLDLIRVVERALLEQNLVVAGQAHALSKDWSRYFGLIEIKANNSNSDYRWVLGIRNSHDKTLPVGLVAGTQVMVCDNLAFAGEVRFTRKHTRFVYRDLLDMARESIQGVKDAWGRQDHRIETYKQATIGDVTAHDLIIRSVDAGAISNRQVPAVLQAWREPHFEDFSARNVWSLENAFTEALKGSNLETLPERTQRLHGLIDQHIGFN